MMRFPLVLALAVVLAFTSGCAKDARAKRASSLHVAMITTFEREYEAATSPESRDVVVKEYLRRAPELTQLIDDYLHSRRPAEIVPLPPRSMSEPVPDPK